MLKRPKIQTNHDATKLDATNHNVKFKRKFESEEDNQVHALKEQETCKKFHLDESQWALVPYFQPQSSHGIILNAPNQTLPQVPFQQLFLPECNMTFPLYTPLPLSKSDFDFDMSEPESRALITYNIGK